MEDWLKKKPICDPTPATTSVTHIEIETAQNETKQTEAAPDDSSASAGEKDDIQNDGSTSAFLDLGSNPNHVGTSSLPIHRPSHLKIPGGPKMARAALSRRAIDGSCAIM